MFASTAIKKRDHLVKVNRVDILKKNWSGILRTLDNQVKRNKPFSIYEDYINEDTIRCLSYIGFELSGEKVAMAYIPRDTARGVRGVDGTEGKFRLLLKPN